MRKLSQINEGFWKDSIKRVKNKEMRQEDYIDSNVKNFREIDLGFDFVFASTPLVIEKNMSFSYEEVKDKVDVLTKYFGWRLPTIKDLDVFCDDDGELKDNIYTGCVSKFSYTAEIYNKDYFFKSPNRSSEENVLIIHWQQWGVARFIMEPKDEHVVTNTTWTLRRKYDTPNEIRMGYEVVDNKDRFPVLLIKDKRR